MVSVCNNRGGLRRADRTQSQSTGAYLLVAAWQPKCYWKLDPTLLTH